MKISSKVGSSMVTSVTFRLLICCTDRVDVAFEEETHNAVWLFEIGHARRCKIGVVSDSPAPPGSSCNCSFCRVLISSDLDDLALADDRHPVAQALHLAEDVRGEEHGGTASGFPRGSGRRSCCCINGSRPAVGSSRMISLGECSSPWTIPTFFLLPYERSSIRRLRSSSMISARS